ncbi:hypothetical protein GGR54DRAFT_640505 [Hypoxylon sp. NC1633]|nr:hypothetical protein GGR54DRAFT_640505 [Hypoxylon sp. NC1633]
MSRRLSPIYRHTLPTSGHTTTINRHQPTSTNINDTMDPRAFDSLLDALARIIILAWSLIKLIKLVIFIALIILGAFCIGFIHGVGYVVHGFSKISKRLRTADPGAIQALQAAQTAAPGSPP